MKMRCGGTSFVLCLGVLAAPGFGSDFTFNKLVDTNTPVPGGTFGNFTSVNLVATDGNNVAFTGSFVSAGTTYSGLYQYNGGAVSTIADLSVSAPSGGTFQKIIGGNDYLGGNLVFGAQTASGLGIYRFTGGGINTVVAPGTVMPWTNDTIGSLESKGVSGDANTAAFAGTSSSDGSGVLFLHANSQTNFIADDETHVPGIELGVFHTFPEVHARNGAVLFVGTAADPDAGDNVFEPAGLFLAQADGPIQSIGTRSTIIPDEPDFYFKEFENPRIGNDGRFYFTGGFLEKEPGVRSGGRGVPPDHFMGVFAIDDQGNIETIADSEIALPGLMGEIEEYNRYSLENGARVFGVNDVNGVSYLYVQDPDGSFRHVLDSTEMLDGKQLTTLRMTLDPTSDGITSFRAVFADGSSGVYSFAVPEPTGFATLAICAAATALSRRRRRFLPS